MNVKGWAITLVGALFFFYSFFQTNMMTSLNPYLMNEFSVPVGELGIIAAICFYANVLFILPAGLFLDRFSVKKLMFINMFLAIGSTILFAMAHSLFVMGIARFFAGIMMAFGLIMCLKLASFWIPQNKMALASSLIVTIGMLGGMCAQTPLYLCIDAFGWRGSMICVALLGLFFSLLFFLFIKEPKKEESKVQAPSVFKSLKTAFFESQNWIAALFITFLNLPLAILGAFFGVVYLMDVYSYSIFQASSVVSMLFVGMIVGSPCFGWVSDYLGKRRFSMFLGALGCLIFILSLMYIPNLSPGVLYFIFFGIGFNSGSQVLGYPIISENNPSETTGAALGIASILIVGGGYGLGLPLASSILDWSGKNYQLAFLFMPICILIGAGMAGMTKKNSVNSVSVD